MVLKDFGNVVRPIDCFVSYYAGFDDERMHRIR